MDSSGAGPLGGGRALYVEAKPILCSQTVYVK
jgi:hypothetical protein